MYFFLFYEKWHICTWTQIHQYFELDISLLLKLTISKHLYIHLYTKGIWKILRKNKCIKYCIKLEVVFWFRKMWQFFFYTRELIFVFKLSWALILSTLTFIIAIILHKNLQTLESIAWCMYQEVILQIYFFTWLLKTIVHTSPTIFAS